MILERKLLLDTLRKENLLTISAKQHERTWKYYYKQYHKAFYIFLTIAKQKRYRTNRKCRPFLFIMRHSVELYLKNKIAQTPNSKVPSDHNIKNLYREATISDNYFLQAFACLNCDSGGDCWRYLLAGEVAQSSIVDPVQAFDACNYYCSVLSHDTSLAHHSTDKKLLNELTFHLWECGTLGLIGTEYDWAITDLLSSIKDKEVSINEVYLPLLFLLRHSLEIKLKDALEVLSDHLTVQEQGELRTHSVKKLYEILNKYISHDINAITDARFKQRCQDLSNATNQYKDIVASLDANSFSFRFPKDKKGNDSNFTPQPNVVADILSLYWEADPFLCFATRYFYPEVEDDL